MKWWWGAPLPTAELIKSICDYEIHWNVIWKLNCHESRTALLLEIVLIESYSACMSASFVPECISFLLLMDLSPSGHGLSCYTFSGSWLYWMKNPTQRKLPIASGCSPWNLLPAQPCLGSAICVSHLDYWVNLLRAPLPQLSSFRPSFKPHEKFYKNRDVTTFFILSFLKSHK